MALCPQRGEDTWKRAVEIQQDVAGIPVACVTLLCHKSSAQTTTQRAARKLLHQESGDPDT